MFKLKRRNKLPQVDDQLLLTPAHKLSKQIKDGSLSCVKLCELYAERIKQVQPIINGMAQDRFKEALEEARRIDNLLATFRAGKEQECELSSDELEMLNSPLLGVPISIKESIQIKGMKNSCGLYSRKNTIANSDAVIISNIKRLGMIPICTSNIPECTLYWGDCQNKVYGRSLNPYDLSRITGGSSGGEAALISSAASIIGIGSDIGGSLRIPAHYCGIYSIKPSPFLISSEGNFPSVLESRLRMFSLGPMSRYASDLRPLFKCLLQDKENSKQDTYFKFQPENIDSIRKKILQRLDETFDLNQLKLFYYNFNNNNNNDDQNQSTTTTRKGKQSIGVNPEFMDSQQEILDHFRSKYNCQTEQINLDKFLRKGLIIWKCMLLGAGVQGSEENYREKEILETFEIDSLLMEILKLPFGLSHHTKESVLAILSASSLPSDKERLFPLCEKFEKLASVFKKEIEEILGDNGILITPSMPTLAYKHHVSLLKTRDLRFSSFANILQMPASHATIGLDKKHKLPFGFTAMASQYNDHLPLAFAEEIEIAFGGWRPPKSMAVSVIDGINDTNSSLVNSDNENSKEQKKQLKKKGDKKNKSNKNQVVNKKSNLPGKPLDGNIANSQQTISAVQQQSA